MRPAAVVTILNSVEFSRFSCRKLSTNTGLMCGMADAYFAGDREHSIEGNWWISNRPDDHAVGRLIYRPRTKLELQLSGRWDVHKDPLKTFWGDGDSENFTVYGRTLTDLPVTLQDCYVHSLREGAEIVHVNGALVGVHYDKSSDPLVSLIVLTISNLQSWAGGFDTKLAPPKSKLVDQFEITAGPANATDITDGTLSILPGRVRIRHHVAPTRSPNSLQLDYKCDLWINLDKALPLDRTQWIAANTVRLMGLLIGRPTIVTTEYFGFADLGGASYLAQRWERLEPPSPERVRPPCPLNQPGFEFATLLNGWLAISARLQTPIELLHAVLMKTGAFLETEVTELMQAIEGLCSETNPFTYLPDDEFKSVYDGMLDVIREKDEQFRERIKGTLRHLNRPSLRSHLRGLLNRLDPKIVKNVIGTRRVQDFIGEMVDLRNAIAHPQSGSIWDSYKPTQVLEFVSRLKMLLVLALLTEAGMPVEVLIKRYHDYRQWQWG